MHFSALHFVAVAFLYCCCCEDRNLLRTLYFIVCERLCKPDKNVITVNCFLDEISVGFLGKFKHDSLLMSGLRYKLDASR